MRRRELGLWWYLVVTAVDDLGMNTRWKGVCATHSEGEGTAVLFIRFSATGAMWGPGVRCRRSLDGSKRCPYSTLSTCLTVLVCIFGVGRGWRAEEGRKGRAIHIIDSLVWRVDQSVWGRERKQDGSPVRQGGHAFVYGAVQERLQIGWLRADGLALFSSFGIHPRWLTIEPLSLYSVYY